MEPEIECRPSAQSTVKCTQISGISSTDIDDSTATVHMKRQITAIGGIALIIGSMIGTGIFISAGNLMKRTDSAAGSLVMWTVCGVLAIFMSLSYAELGTLIPRSGGEHAVFQDTFKPLHRYFGELPAFLYAWSSLILIRPSGLAILSLTFAQYLLKPFIIYLDINSEWEKSEAYDWARKFLAILFCWSLGAMNVMNIKMVERLIITCTTCKVMTIALIIGIGAYSFGVNGIGNIPTTYDVGEASISDYAFAAYSAQWAYDGWHYLNTLLEELENPERNLPLAIFIGIPFVMACYLAVNLSYLALLTKTEIQESTAVAVDAAASLLGSMNWIIPLLVAVSATGTAGANIFTSGRIGYAASRDGHMPSIISNVHAHYLSPSIAILVHIGISMILILNSGVNDLIDFFGFVSWIFFALALIAVLVLRHTRPNDHRPFKLPMVVPIIALLAALFLVLAPLQQPNVGHIYVLGFFALGTLWYTCFVYRKREFGITETLTKKIQLMMYVAPSPYRED